MTSGEPASDAPLEQLDLTTRPGEAEASGELIRPEERPYDPAREREKKRGVIAVTLVSALCGIVAMAFVYVFVALLTGGSVELLKSVLEIIYAPIVGLVGAVTGFYFGERSR